MTLVGGPGFEPGPSRSRNLCGLVRRARFRRLWANFEDSLTDFQRVFSHQRRPDKAVQFVEQARSGVDSVRYDAALLDAIHAVRISYSTTALVFLPPLASGTWAFLVGQSSATSINVSK